MILASGSIAKNFIAWVGRKRVADNHYYVTCYKEDTTPKKLGKNITLIEADPTSYSKLSRIMSEHSFSNIFVVLEDKVDAEYTLKNIALFGSKSRVFLVNQWEDKTVGNDIDNLYITHVNELMAAHLYDNLPNVPLVAQNVGLGKGDIMEVHIPVGSSYAYRHVDSIRQHKWKIAAIYRDDKQILPTANTMIRPNDTILIVGKPLALDGVYKSINKRIGLFPEPFGKDIYLMLDFRYDKSNALTFLQESVYLLEKLENKSLYIRILYPNDFTLINELKGYESENVMISISYENENVKQIVSDDIDEHDIGLVMTSIPSFESDGLKDTLYNLEKLVYLFGDKHLYNITKSVVLMSDEEKTESISSTAFDISQALELNLMLADFDPEGDFESKKIVVEHYETLAHIFNKPIKIVQKISNPIRELSNMNSILQVAPFEERLNSDNFLKFVSTKVQDFLLTTTRHPKLLVPIAQNYGKEES